MYQGAPLARNRASPNLDIGSNDEVNSIGCFSSRPLVLVALACLLDLRLATRVLFWDSTGYAILVACVMASTLHVACPFNRFSISHRTGDMVNRTWSTQPFANSARRFLISSGTYLFFVWLVPMPSRS